MSKRASKKQFSTVIDIDMTEELSGDKYNAGIILSTTLIETEDGEALRDEAAQVQEKILACKDAMRDAFKHGIATTVAAGGIDQARERIDSVAKMLADIVTESTGCKTTAMVAPIFALSPDVNAIYSVDPSTKVPFILRYDGDENPDDTYYGFITANAQNRKDAKARYGRWEEGRKTGYRMPMTGLEATKMLDDACMKISSGKMNPVEGNEYITDRLFEGIVEPIESIYGKQFVSSGSANSVIKFKF